MLSFMATSFSRNDLLICTILINHSVSVAQQARHDNGCSLTHDMRLIIRSGNVRLIMCPHHLSAVTT